LCIAASKKRRKKIYKRRFQLGDYVNVNIYQGVFLQTREKESESERKNKNKVYRVVSPL
jgi:hypothetical protein